MFESPDGMIWLLDQHWDWKIAVYLFFGGLAGGAYLTGVVAELLGLRSEGPDRKTAMQRMGQWGMITAVAAIAVGGIILFTHLGAPLRALLFPVLFVNFGSWLVIGTWVIVLFAVVAAIQAFWLIWGPENAGGFSSFPAKITAWIEDRSGVPLDTWVRKLASWTHPGTSIRLGVHALGSVLAVGLIVYTALLLSDVAWLVPVWDRSLLPFLFLASGLSIGLAATAGLTAFFEGLEGTSITGFSLLDDVVILGEIAVLALLVRSLTGGDPAAIASYETITGEFALLFWGGIVVLGLVGPLVLSAAILLLEWRTDVHASDRLERIVRGVYTAKFGFVVLGGLFLRYLILFTAVKAPLAPA